MPVKEKNTLQSSGPGIIYTSRSSRASSVMSRVFTMRLAETASSSRTAAPFFLFFSDLTTSARRSSASSSISRSASRVTRNGVASRISQPRKNRSANVLSTSSRNRNCFSSPVPGTLIIRSSTEDGTGRMAVLTLLSPSRRRRRTARLRLRLLRNGKGWLGSTAMGVTTG